MEPLSTAAAAIAMVELCVNAVRFVRKAQESARTARAELDTLVDEIAILQNTGDLVMKLEDTFDSPHTEIPPDHIKLLKSFNAGARSTIESCQGFLRDVESLSKDILRTPTLELSKFDAVKLAIRKDRRKNDIEKLRMNINSGQNKLQIFYISINILQVSAAATSAKGASDSVRKLGFDLKRQITLMNMENVGADDTVLTYLSPVTNLIKSMKLNKYFDVPRCIGGSFVGREKLLQRLKQAFDESRPTSSTLPKVFVIYGFPGSGKTEFAFKFAEQYRECFWGVFVVQADSESLLVDSFRRIAQYADKKAVLNMALAKHWLANQRLPWLLILDNADDPDIDIRNYLPASPTGCILITTRNRDFKMHGNAGEQCFNFERLSHDEAKLVLLQAAAEPNPIRPYADAAAGRISDELQCLPLALVTAGRTIRSKLASWKTYLNWYRRSCTEISRRLNAGSVLKEVEQAEYTVIPALEPHLRQLEMQTDRTSVDAIDLINTLAYFHHRNISLRLLKLVAKNANKMASEAQPQGNDKPGVDAASKSFGLPSSISARIMDATMRMISGPPTLPSVLKNINNDSLDEDRLRAALSKLEKLNLIRLDDAEHAENAEADQFHEDELHHSTLNSHQNDSDGASSSDVDDAEYSYSLHPLIHSWVRQRQPRIAVRALWCAAAVTAISQCIVLEREAFMGKTSSYFEAREILPHMAQAHVFKDEIEQQLTTNKLNAGWLRQLLKSLWLIPTETCLLTQRNNALTSMKFSLVYSLCGDFHRAAELQSKVRSFVVAVRGMNSAIAISITLALASTMQHLTNFAKACELQAEVVEACKSLYGVEDAQTLTMMDIYGLLLRFEGRLIDSLDYQQKAYDGFKKLGPKYVRQTLVTKAHIAAGRSGFLRLEEARELCEEAISGLEDIDPDDDEILSAKETLSVLYGELHKADQAYALAEEVYRMRKRKLGEQHPLTLWAAAICSRGLWRLKRYNEAIETLSRPLTIAEMTFGPNNFAYLSAITLRACILTSKGSFTEADDLFSFLDERFEILKKERGRDHPDRILSMGYRVDCYQEQGKFRDALRTCERMLDIFRTINKDKGWRHPLRSVTQRKFTELQSICDSQTGDHKELKIRNVSWTPLMDFQDVPTESKV